MTFPFCWLARQYASDIRTHVTAFILEHLAAKRNLHEGVVNNTFVVCRCCVLRNIAASFKKNEHTNKEKIPAKKL